MCVTNASVFYMSLLLEDGVQGIVVPVIVVPALTRSVCAPIWHAPTALADGRKIYSGVPGHELLHGGFFLNVGEWRYFINAIFTY